MNTEDYKETQRRYKRLNKERGSFVWISKSKGDFKGKTYVKKDEELKEMFKNNIKVEEKGVE